MASPEATSTNKYSTSGKAATQQPSSESTGSATSEANPLTISASLPLATTLTEHLSYLPENKIVIIMTAFHFAFKAHDGQYRRSGDPYITHPVAVAIILAGMKMDSATICAALLHDVIEDCNVSKETLSTQFSPIVADLVDGVTKIGAIKFESKAEAQAENFRKMVMAMTQDIRVILVKLADRLHNMRTLSVLNPNKRRRIATETLEIYAPIANRLGMHNIRNEFEDLGFTALYPMRAQRIQQAVKKARGNRKEIMKTLEEAFSHIISRHNIDAKLTGREKHLYSIYKKMRAKQRTFPQIMDVYGFRLVLNSIDDCYRCLGIVHNLYKPIPGRFKDYIAIPKANGYQSLHTTLIGLNGVPIEIQIRTEDMDAMAKNGIAAHWLYKSEEEPSEGAKTRTQQWLKGLLELQRNAGSSLEFIENVKIDLFPDEVYVFTPKGEILELPNGATPIDFAYAVHTDVGNTCVAARIDHRLAPLSTPLKSGQTLEIIDAPGSSPNIGWLSFAVTSKARSNIRHYLKNQRTSESIHLGRRLLAKALASFAITLEDISPQRLTIITNELELENENKLFEEIGLGNHMAPLVARRLIEEKSSDEHGYSDDNNTGYQRPLIISGAEGMVINFARCCNPIPGDGILAFLSSGRGIIIHTNTCRNFSQDLKEQIDKCLPVKWDDNVIGTFTAKLKLEVLNQRGALAEISSTIAICEADIETVHMGDKEAQVSMISVSLSVSNRVHLARIIRKLRNNSCVSKIIRIKG